VDWDAVF
jgi:hypothetical protein